MSIVSIQEDSPIFVILRRDYLDITNDFCAAKLIEYFKHWTNWKITVHRTPWIYQPLKRIYQDLMGEHSLHVIRRAITLLEEIGLIERRHNPGNWQDKTWQYKLNLGKLSELLEDRKRRIEQSKLQSEQLHNINPENPDPNNNYVAVEEMSDAKWEEVAKQVHDWEIRVQQEEVESISSTDLLISQEDQLSRAALNSIECEFVVMNSGEAKSGTGMISGADSAVAVCSPSAIAPNNSHQSRIINDADIHPPKDISIQNLPVKPLPMVPKKLTQAEIEAVADELKYLRINPDVCMGVVRKYWSNVQGAIARVKEAIQQNWCTNPTGLFIASCKSGAKAQKLAESGVNEWFTWARSRRIVIAMSGEIAYTPDGEPVSLREIMELHPIKR